MKRRDFIKRSLAMGTLYTAGGFSSLDRVAQANSFPALGSRVLVNIMLNGAPDLRHLFTPEFSSNPASYGYQYWQARVASHAIADSESAWENRWTNDYFPVADGAISFGILKKCGWLRDMWNAGNVAIVANAIGGATRNHSHCRLIMNQGLLDSGPNDFDRTGWGGRLAYHSGRNILSLTRTPEAFVYGPDAQRLITLRNTRQAGLYRPAPDEYPFSQKRSIGRSLRNYYAALRQEMDPESVYYTIVEHERKLREFGEPIEDRLLTEPLPASISSLADGALNSRYLGEMIRNLYDTFLCSDILGQSVAPLAIGGWDSHAAQKDLIEPKLEDLFGTGKAFDVLFSELPTTAVDDTVFILGGEFGRQLRANGDNGTDHGRGTYILVIGNGVRGGVYGDMFPDEEIARLADRSPDITGQTTIDKIYGRACDWVQPGTGGLVFPDQSRSMIEPGVDLSALFV